MASKNLTEPITPTISRRPRVRKAQLEDHAGIAALHRRNHLDALALADWKEHWLGNPAYREVACDWPIGWVLESAEGEIVGSIGNLPSRYHLGTRRVLAATACSWVTDAPFRGYSMALLSQFISQKMPDLLLSTTVSPGAEPGMKIFQCRRSPSGCWDRTRFWITSYPKAARCWLARKSEHLARLMAGPAAAILFLHDALRRGSATPPEIKTDIELAYTFDERFCEFWTSLQAENRHTLLACRSRDTLCWHFRRSLSQKQAWILSVSDARRLTAFAVFDRQDNVELGLKRIRLVDFQALDGSSHFLKFMLAEMMRRARREGIHVIECVGCWLDRFPLAELRPLHQRLLPSWMFYYKSPRPELAEILQDPGAWSPSSFDGDASL